MVSLVTALLVCDLVAIIRARAGANYVPAMVKDRPPQLRVNFINQKPNNLTKTSY